METKHFHIQLGASWASIQKPLLQLFDAWIQAEKERRYLNIDKHIHFAKKNPDHNFEKM
jgi:hypothetical protein